jgi:hypothetical protein
MLKKSMLVIDAEAYRVTHSLQFQFVGVVERDGTYPIHMTTMEITKVQEGLDQIIAMEPDTIEIEFGDPCTGDGWHSTRCQLRMEHLSEPCILDQVVKARHRKQRLNRLDDLTKCAKHPLEANGMRTLEGMATGSCIYEVE